MKPESDTDATRDDKRQASSLRRSVLWVLSLLVIVGAVVAAEVAWTAPTRGAVRTYEQLIAAANRADLEAAGSLCTARYRKAQPLKLADEGGIVGLPRNIHKNFQVWTHGRDVWLCPTNRVGPVYQFVREGDQWRFDGAVGLLMPDGKVVEGASLEDASELRSD